jgi:hypothetical protein
VLGVTIYGKDCTCDSHAQEISHSLTCCLFSSVRIVPNEEVQFVMCKVYVVQTVWVVSVLNMTVLCNCND